MNRQFGVAAAAAVLGLCAGQTAQAACKQQIIASIPIVFVNNEPMVEASINGKPANLRFSLNTDTYLWGTALKEYGLKETVGNTIAWASGPGGSAEATATSVHELKTGTVVQKDANYYMVYAIQKPGEAGVFGSSAFAGKTDIELDFANNVVRAVKSEGCKDDEVVYWSGSYSVVQRTKSGLWPMTLAGKPLNGYFDPGNEVTFVTEEGARDVGVSLQAAGPLPMGMIGGGVIKPIEVSIAKFPELTVGDETIKNAPLAVGDVWPHNRPDFLPQVILGADFARSHRIYISREQRKVYFSYVGGTLFGDIYKRLGVEAALAPPTPQAAPKR